MYDTHAMFDFDGLETIDKTLPSIDKQRGNGSVLVHNPYRNVYAFASVLELHYINA